ncbi:nucleotidyltransferase domain-containing protein [Gemmatimonadota bacterium]
MPGDTTILKRLFSSGLRISVLSHFFMNPGESFYVRSLANLLGESAGNLARELTNLEEAGLLRSKAVGNQKHFSLCEDSPIHEDLRNLFLKTVGIGGEIRDLLSQAGGIELAYLFGSFASGEAGSTSDLDLMIIGEISDRKLAPLMAELESRLHREINYVIYSRKEAEERIQEEGDFIAEVFRGPRIILIGQSDDGLL